MLVVFYILAAILIWLSFKSLLGGVHYLAYFRRELARPPSGYAPQVSVIVPCRGVDHALEDNLNAILSQDYHQYEVIFVVDDDADPASAIIRERVSEHIRLVVAPKATDSGQKVENLRAGVGRLSPLCEVIVFTDSDARPAADWLEHLVAPLADDNVGAASGYRWFISDEATFASEMRSAWNASIASALGPNRRSNFCWGGSTAIRRDVFERLEIRDKWRGTVSDDFVLAEIVKAAGLEIVFVPKALNASISSCTLGELIEFTNRQMKLTRVYAPHLWLMTLFGTGLFNAVLAVSLAIIAFSSENDQAVWVSIAILTLITIFSIGKAWLRLSAVRLSLTHHDDALRRQFFTQNTLWALTGLLFFWNSVAALLSRRITWRGITYELKSPRETVIVDRE